jgi:hypothetical protein
MKRAVTFLPVLCLLISCSKNSATPDPAPSTASRITSSYRYYPDGQSANTRIYTYDSNNNLIKIYMREQDTAGNPYKFIDSGSMYFAIDPSTHLPASYYSDWFDSDFGNGRQTNHILYYNNQHQLIKDSLLASNNNAADHDLFFYASQLIIWQSATNQHSGNAQLLDSMFLSNNNLIRKLSYYWDDDLTYAYKLSDDWKVVPTNYTNPFYDPVLSPSIGAFLLCAGVDEFISQNLTNDDGFTYTTDAKGRVISGTGPDGGIVKFTYQN